MYTIPHRYSGGERGDTVGNSRTARGGAVWVSNRRMEPVHTGGSNYRSVRDVARAHTVARQTDATPGSIEVPEAAAYGVPPGIHARMQHKREVCRAVWNLDGPTRLEAARAALGWCK